jgi:c-di-GMP phosphodiesterase
MTKICLGRQAVYDRDLKVLGYRITSYDESGTTSARDIVESLTSFGLDKVIGGGTAFIRVSVGELGQVPTFLPKERYVVEITADLAVDHGARTELSNLIKSGYAVALGGCPYVPDLDAVFKAVKYVNYDAAALDKDTVAKLLAVLKTSHAKMTATNVDTHASFRDCCALGFECFQGYFVCEPDLADDKELKASRLGSMRLLAKLHEPDLDLPDLEAIIEQDVTLSYKLLRYLNSAFFALPSKIESIKRALLLLGLRPVRNWASMIVLAGFDDKPQELVINAMLRAKFCELLARAKGIRAADGYFTVGLLSTLDAFLNKPMTDALQLVPLSDEIKAAILQNEGVMGDVLATVKAYERGQVKKIVVPQGQEPVVMADVFFEAVGWVTECSAELIMGNSSRRAA